MNRPKTLNLKLLQTLVKDKKGKIVKGADNEDQYLQNDCAGIQSLLGKFDSKKYTMKDYRSYLKIKDKFYYAWIKDNEEVELSLDEAVFLKDFLKSLVDEKDKERQSLRDFELRTLISFIDQLE